MNAESKRQLQTILTDHQRKLQATQTEFDSLQRDYQQAQQDIVEEENKIKLQNEAIKVIDKFADKFVNVLEDIQQKHSDSLNQISSRVIDVLDKNEKQKMKETTPISRFLKNTEDMPSFKDVIGMETEIEQLKDSLEYLKNIKEYKKMGINKMPKGILLYGPPGTGKTYLAEAFAKESGLPVFALTSADFSKTYVGESPKLIQDLFDAARKNSPSIILIDECESVFRSRNHNLLISDHGNIISAFLSQIEGIHTDKKKPVFIIGTTNFKDQIDESILSRFNRHIKVDFWNQKGIKKFLETKALSYKLDIEAYQYLVNDLSKIIAYSDNDLLKTPRRMIELLDQASIIARRKHDHVNILLEDLHLAFNRISQSSIPANWDLHTHRKKNWKELVNFKEYKQIEIKHLFKDSRFQGEERKYFNAIRNKHNILGQVVYNKNSDNEIQNININEYKSNIKKTFNTENPFPSELLGFYFQDNQDEYNYNNNKKRLEPKNVESLEDVLNTGIKVTKKIYFMWDLSKQHENQKTFYQLLEKYLLQFPFLVQESTFGEAILIVSQNIENNELEIEQSIIKFINEIKEKLIEEIIDEISFSSIKNEILNFDIKTVINDKIEKIWKRKDILSLEVLKSETIHEVKSYLEQYLDELLQNKIKEELSKISFNPKIFSTKQIYKIKKDFKQKIHHDLISFIIPLKQHHIELDEQIQNKINEYKLEYFHIDRSIYKEIWQEKIYSKLKINLPHFEKEKLNQLILQKTVKTLFFTDYNIDEIIHNLQQDIDKYTEKFWNDLNHKISDITNQYILMENNWNPSLDHGIVQWINKVAFLIAEKEAKRNNATEKSIEEAVYSFIQNYKINNQKIDPWFYITYIFKKNIYKITLYLILLFIVWNMFFKIKKQKSNTF
ncbi:MAG: AAA family ATPase, partial [Weeping tea tree witches'-broom phytoplasma]|uniref:AAA family ATPase n=1 Tax=Candidatus Phytoplasma melaleucae TaxID=2982630 RepID=UPI002939AA0D|nr:AAA family ATPase [Weeping tea tree witches'-broom phytoplasma]